MSGKLVKNHSKKWKHNYVTKGNYTGTTKACMGEIRRAEELKKLQLAKGHRMKQKEMYKYLKNTTTTKNSRDQPPHRKGKQLQQFG